MRVLPRKPLRAFTAIHPDSGPSLDRWFRIAERADWSNFASVRSDFPQADRVGVYYVFNVSGNKYRLIAEIDFEFRRVYVREVLTHRDYDRGNWDS